MKKVHYWKTPEGKARLAARRQSNQTPEHADHGTALAQTREFAYIQGRIDQLIETYAQSAGLPQESLATELGKILCGKNRR
jgi:hypothetical protein